MEREVTALIVFIAVIGVAVSFAATVFAPLPVGFLGLAVLVGGLVGRSLPAIAVGGVLLSGPLIYLALAIAH